MQDVKIGIPEKFLRIVKKVLTCEYGIESEISIHGKAPCLVLETCNICFFASSGDFRIFYPDPLPGGISHQTFSDVEEMLAAVDKLYV